MSAIFYNTSNNNFTVRLLKDYLHAILNRNLLHIRCVYHILNLSVQSSISMVQDIIIKIKNIVSFIQTSKKKFKNLSKYV